MALNTKHHITISIIIILVILFAILLLPDKSDTSKYLYSQVQKGDFISQVHSTGQLQTENSELIVLPQEMWGRNIDIYEIKVTNIVEEGTVVDSGGYVATLDYATVEQLKNKANDELGSALNAYEDARIDTNLNLSTLRDELLNAKVDLEEKKIILDQSIYESPAVKRQAKLDVERTQRDLEQKQHNYILKQKQDELKVYRALEDVKIIKEKVSDINKLYKALNVKAPKPGLVIYSYDRFGNKIKPGSSVSRWMPKIAELPDLSSMVSKTFINEIDISKINTGQAVSIGIDAFPEKHFDGKVVTVANIGQVIPNSDAKVFEVTIKINGTDNDLRPGMTTSNIINTASLKDALFAPLECVFANDSLNYVFIKKGSNKIRKQIINPGINNENNVQITKGVKENDILLMNIPDNADKIDFAGIEIFRQMVTDQTDSTIIN